MPNGRPGDHPYTDIVLHDYEVYSGTVSRLVHPIAEAENESAIKQASSLLWDAGWDASGAELAALKADLYNLCLALERGSDTPHEDPLAACLADADVYTPSVRALVREIHEEIQDEIDNEWWVLRRLSGILWEFGWTTDRIESLTASLEAFREETVREQHD